MDDSTARMLFGVAAKPVQNFLNGPSQDEMDRAVQIAMEQDRQAQNKQPQQMKKGGKVAGKLATRGYGISKHGSGK